MAAVTVRLWVWRATAMPAASSIMRRITPPWTLPCALASGGCMGRATTTREALTGRPFIPALAHSHSMVLGGLEEMSKTTRLTPLTSLMMRFEILPSSS